MQYKFYILKVLTLIFAIFVWWMSGNINVTGMQAVAASCQKIGQIQSIKYGTVERKQPGSQFQKVAEGTSLCKGDLLSTKSKAGKIVIVKISCTDPSLPNWILSGNSLAGVNNRCTPGSNPNIPI
ncbi:MAG: hypothetical protein V7K68_16395 [Nostoc sp.]|uniref:hypothetical protein n=1 Tax=Nostoc sp. TaxID=1180 RepID=UPI002FF48FE1